MPIELLAPCHGALDAFHDDQLLWRDGEHRVPGTLGGAPPVGGGAVTPGCASVRFVLEVEGHDVVVVAVPLGHHLPRGDPVRLAVAVLSVPEVVHEAVIGEGVVVEDDHQTESIGLVHDDVHHLQRGLAREFGVLAPAVVNAVRGGRIHRLHGERHADRVEPEVLDLAEHVLVVAGPQAVGRMGCGLEAEPVDALPHNGLAGGVDDAIAVSVQGVRRTRASSTGCLEAQPAGEEGEECADQECDAPYRHGVSLVVVRFASGFPSAMWVSR